jgi:hypothetical protein
MINGWENRGKWRNPKMLAVGTQKIAGTLVVANFVIQI